MWSWFLIRSAAVVWWFWPEHNLLFTLIFFISTCCKFTESICVYKSSLYFICQPTLYSTCSLLHMFWWQKAQNTLLKDDNTVQYLLWSVLNVIFIFKYYRRVGYCDSTTVHCAILIPQSESLCCLRVYRVNYPHFMFSTFYSD